MRDNCAGTDPVPPDPDRAPLPAAQRLTTAIGTEPASNRPQRPDLQGAPMHTQIHPAPLAPAARAASPYTQTRSFSTIALIELWERFGYYGMQALIVYFLVQRLGFEDSRANLVWGACAALIYVSPAIGGWIGDKVLGTKRSMIIGALILTIGYALMAVPTINTWFLFSAIGVVVVGTGLFKPNIANLVRKIYEGDDKKIDSAFTLYYMSVNVGSTISILATPWIKDYVNATYGHELGWHAAFAVCSGGLVLGLANILLMRHTLRHVGSLPDEQPLNIGKLLMVLVGGVL